MPTNVLFFQVFKIVKIKNFGTNLENYSWKTFRPLLSSSSSWIMPFLIKIFTFKKVVSCFKYWSSIGSVRDSYWNVDPGYYAEHFSGLHKGCVCGVLEEEGITAHTGTCGEELFSQCPCWSLTLSLYCF